MYTIGGTSNDEIGSLLGNWYANKLKFDFSPPFSAVGFLNENGIQGAALFSDYNGSNIEMHYYGPRCVTRQNFKVVLDYVFNQLKCNRFTVKPYRKDKILIDIVKRLGFIYEGELKNYYGIKSEEDAIIYYMTKIEANKWIKLYDA